MQVTDSSLQRTLNLLRYPIWIRYPILYFERRLVREMYSAEKIASIYPALKPARESSKSSRMDNRESAEALILRRAADSGICVLIEVTNNSKLSLESKRYYCESGKILYHGLETISPGAKDWTLFGKKSFTACGSVGVLTFQLNDRQSNRLAILFSNPFNNIIYDRTFALCFTKTGASARQLYEDMYYKGEHLENYTEAHKDAVIQFPHELLHNGIKVTATMSAESKSILRVVVEDMNEDRSAAGKGNSGRTNPRGYSLHGSNIWNYNERCNVFQSSNLG